MELLFTWIKDYRNIQNQGINFSAEFNISFNHQTNVLSIEKAPNYIPSFFGKMISNISVIVGENGTGKTSILNLQGAIFYLGIKNEKYFIVCEDKKLLGDINIQTDFQTEICKYPKLDYYDTLIIQYSNYIDNFISNSSQSLFRSDCFWDFSTNTSVNRLVEKLLDNREENFHSSSYNTSSHEPKDREIKMHISEIEKQMSFVLKNGNQQKLKFKTPETLDVYFNIDSAVQLLSLKGNEENGFGEKDSNIEWILESFLIKQLPNQFKKKNKNSHTLELKVSEKAYALFLLRWSMFFSFINSFTYSGGSAQWLAFDDIGDNKPIEEWFNDFFTKKIISIEDYIKSKYSGTIETWAKNAVNFVQQFEQVLETDLVTFSYSQNDSLFKYIDVEDNKAPYWIRPTLSIDISKKESSDFLYQRLVVNYQKIQTHLFGFNVNRNFLSLSWRGVSSGEVAMLRIFSRFNSIRNIIKQRRDVPSIGYSQGQITHLLFLIDEGEIGLHPSWQQQFLNTMIENLSQMFEDEGVMSIQLVLATHSPFILSDVPNNHVIFLEKDTDGKCKVIKNPLHDKKMTFGANIHSLLSDGFFMKDGLMGDFAKKKINQLIDDLLEKGNQLSPERKAEIQKMIPLIGEPIIRKKVMDLYNEQINLNIDDRIKQLEESRKQLEKDIQMLKKAKQDDSNKKK